MLVDVPNEVVAAIFQQSGLQISFANKRLAVTRQLSAEADPAWELVARLTRQAADAVKPETLCTAYGFNYELHVLLSGERPAGEYLRDVFVADRERVETVAGGTLASVGIEFSFHLQQMVQNMRLKENMENRNVADTHINSHFLSEHLPDDSVLADQLSEQYQESINMLHRLLEP
ncbi:MAG: hypothetical protein EPO21_18035 [Chloroflexota bacterium]|nr:MAG: hypothetical protein EPO21_18035 [Chloroflexota bacterium]